MLLLKLKKSEEKEIKSQRGVGKREAEMVTGEEGEGRYNVICNVPVRCETKPCTTEILPPFRFHSM